ncbi:MAG: ompA 1 [Burkholderiaceae bacterium]|nr:ompA 1 [Burkholderiaceae bacterium]
MGADALFAFDRGGLSDLNPKGKYDLDNLATQLKQFDQLNSVKITGHTDYLGSDAYNLRLSEQRAQTVRQYLFSKGLPVSKMMAVGMGESQPVKQCANTGNRSALIACLQPNRRVEVEVDGSGKE